MSVLNPRMDDSIFIIFFYFFEKPRSADVHVAISVSKKDRFVSVFMSFFINFRLCLIVSRVCSLVNVKRFDFADFSPAHLFFSSNNVTYFHMKLSSAQYFSSKTLFIFPSQNLSFLLFSLIL